MDRPGKTGYHGYWGVNFYQLDEHLPSPGLDFAGLTAGAEGAGPEDGARHRRQPRLARRTRCRRTSPSSARSTTSDGKLIADHQNLPPEKLDPQHNPLHAFYNTKPGLAQLSDINENDPRVLDYFVGAYSQWIDQGADAFRIDTIGVDAARVLARTSSQRIREKHPGFFMFGEAFDYDAGQDRRSTPGRRTRGVSVLDFPLKERMAEVFGARRQGAAGFERIAERLYLQGGPYANPYDLMTFYDNHDMARLDASDDRLHRREQLAVHRARHSGHLLRLGNRLRCAARAEHAGNRNYFGQERIDAAAGNPIHRAPQAHRPGACARRRRCSAACR